MANKNTQAIYLVKGEDHDKLRFLAFKLSNSMSDHVRDALNGYFNRPDIKTIMAEYKPKELKEQETASTEKKSE